MTQWEREYVLSVDETPYLIHNKKRIPGLKDGSVGKAFAAQTGRLNLEPQYAHSQSEGTTQRLSIAQHWGKEPGELGAQAAQQSIGNTGFQAQGGRLCSKTQGGER